MQVRRLKLRGAKGISRGLGREEIELDFRGFGNGLIALVGPNGAGKSTLLENLHPFRCLASRSGSLQSHFELRDSMKEVEFYSGDSVYLSMIFIDAHTGKSEAYLYKNGEPLNNGLTGTYDAELAKILPDPKLFFVSAFTAQRAKGFADLTPGERKEMLLKLLSFERYELYQKYAKAKRDHLQVEIDAASVLLRMAETEALTLKQLREELENTETLIGLTYNEIDSATSKMDATRNLVNKLNEERVRIEEAVKQCAEKKKVVTETIAEIRAKQADLDGQMMKINLSSRELLESKIFSEGILTNLPKYEQQMKDLEAYKQKIAELEVEERRIKDIREKNLYTRNEYNQLIMAWLRKKENLSIDYVKRVTLAKQSVSKTEADIRAARQQIATMKIGTALLDEVPCSQNAHYVATCKLLALGRTTKENLPVIEKELSDLECRLVEEKEKLETLTKEETTVLEMHSQSKPEEPKYEPEPAFNTKELNWLRNDRDEIIRLKPEASIKAAQAAEKELAVIEERLKGFAETEANLVTQIAQLEIDKDVYETTFLELSNDPSAQAMIEIQTRLNTAGIERDTAERALEAKEHAINRLRENFAVIQNKIEGAKKAEERAAELSAKLVGLRKGFSDWGIIQAGCSKDGIPALELDAAGPAITTIANTLLEETFGSRFQIAFETTRETKDHKQKESFEIIVYGKGEETKLEDLSGGEKVWVEKAIAEAITIHLNESSGILLETGYSDEADGALDPDKKQIYLDMLRAAHKRAGRYHTLVITHTEAIWAQIAQRIILNPETGGCALSYRL